MGSFNDKIEVLNNEKDKTEDNILKDSQKKQSKVDESLIIDESLITESEEDQTKDISILEDSQLEQPSIDESLIVEDEEENNEQIPSEELFIPELEEDTKEQTNIETLTPDESLVVEPETLEEVENTSDENQKEETLEDNINTIEEEYSEQPLLEISPAIEYKEEPKEINSNKKVKKYVSYEKRLITSIASMSFLIILGIISTILYNFTKNEKINFSENSVANYQVCLKQNKYYPNECLNENMEYISQLTDKININFNYNAVFQEARKNNYKYYTKAKISVKSENSKELFVKDEELSKKQDYTSNGNVVSFTEKINIDFEKINKYITTYMNNYSLITDASYTVSFMVFDGTQEKEAATITIPLNKQTFSIDKNIIENQMAILETPINKTVQLIYFISMIIIALILIMNIRKLVKMLKGILKKESKYNKRVKEILTNYDRVIITGKDNNIINKKDNIYEVATFFELLDVRDTIDKPILYYKINNVKSEFYVQDEDTTYRYTLKEADTEK